MFASSANQQTVATGLCSSVLPERDKEGTALSNCTHRAWAGGFSLGEGGVS